MRTDDPLTVLQEQAKEWLGGTRGGVLGRGLPQVEGVSLVACHEVDVTAVMHGGRQGIAGLVVEPRHHPLLAVRREHAVPGSSEAQGII